MPPHGIAAGLFGALSFGAGDFAGAFASRRVGALLSVAAAHGIGLVVLLLWLAVMRPPLPPVELVVLGVAAGVAGVIGLAALYRGMSVGSMGLVTALSGSASLALPLLAGALLGAAVAPLQLVGVGCAAAAAAAAGGASRDEVGRRALALAGLAALGFGAWYVLIDAAARAGDPLWALVMSRATSAGIAAAVVAVRHVSLAGAPWRVLIAAGVLDIGGNALYVVARESIPVGLAAALIGLYPIVTMLFARIFIGERLPRLGMVGVALALVGIVLISVGG